MVLAVLALAGLVVVVFYPITGFDFINLDAPDQILENAYVHGVSRENLGHIFTSRCIDSYYPVRSLSYAIDHQLWGLNAGGFKFTNGLIHLANAFLVFWLILRLFRYTPAGNGTPSKRWDVFAAAFSAGVFAVHPVVVEPVVWVPGREELLTTFGALCCFHSHMTARCLAETGGKIRRIVFWHGCAALFCVMACLSNAVGAVIPLLVTAWDILMLGRQELRRIAAGTFALWVMGVATIVLKKAGGGSEALGPELAIDQRWMVVCEVYWLNLKTLVWPTQLALAYSNVVPKALSMILGGLALGLTCLAIWVLRSRKVLLVGLVWFVLALAPTSQIMPHHMHRADRFLYLPLIGLAVLIATCLRPLGRALKLRVLAGGLTAAAVFCLVVLGSLSARQVQTWRNSICVWEHCLRVVHGSVFAHQSLADALAQDGQYERAFAEYELVLRHEPSDLYALRRYAHCLALCRRTELRDYERAIDLARSGCELAEWQDPDLRRTLAESYMSYGTHLRNGDRLELAIQNYESAAQADPNYEVPLFNLALLYATSDDARFQRPTEAVRLAERACRMKGQPSAVQLAILANVYGETGHAEQAIRTAMKAIRRAEAEGNTEFVSQIRAQMEIHEQRTDHP